MDRQQFISYIHDPGQLNENTLDGISSLAQRFPYCQSLQILHLLNLRQTDEVLYKEYISSTAAHIADRKRLRELILGLQTETVDQHDTVELVESVKLVESDKSEESDQPIQPVQPVQQSESEEPVEPLEAEADETAEKADKEVQDEPFKDIQPVIPAVEEDEEERLKRLKQIVEQRLRQIALEKSELPEPEEPVLSKEELIDKFIEEDPSISRPKPEFFDPVKVAKSSQEEQPDLVTETLARIHVQQGNIEKAIEIYRRLSLNFPEKSSYFAAQIEKLSTEN
jgi:hypothetical protein